MSRGYPGLWALAGVPLVAGLLIAGCISPPRLDLVFISLDTVRRDHLSVYGYPRPTSPTLEHLATRAVLFQDAIAQQTNTNPSHASMITGLYPFHHGVSSNADPLAPGFTTLASVVAGAGYQTAAFVSGEPLNHRLSGFHRGFQFYEDRFPGGRRSGAETVSLAMRWLVQSDPAVPRFLFLHLYDAHGPYLPPAHYQGLFQTRKKGRRLQFIPSYQRLTGDDGQPIVRLRPYIDRYDALLRYLDDQVRRVLDAVDLERTIVIVVADHGETLGERVWPLDHGASVFEEEIRIPLLIYAPGCRPRAVSGPVETVDLFPTILTLLRISPPPDLSFDGRSLASVIQGEGSLPADRSVYAAARADPERHTDRAYDLDRNRSIRTLRRSGWKLIAYPGFSQTYLELYHLVSDPQELRNVAPAEPEIRDRYLRLLARWPETDEEGVATPSLSAEERERLRSLGYLDN